MATKDEDSRISPAIASSQVDNRPSRSWGSIVAALCVAVVMAVGAAGVAASTAGSFVSAAQSPGANSAFPSTHATSSSSSADADTSHTSSASSRSSSSRAPSSSAASSSDVQSSLSSASFGVGTASSTGGSDTSDASREGLRQDERLTSDASLADTPEERDQEQLSEGDTPHSAQGISEDSIEVIDEVEVVEEAPTSTISDAPTSAEPNTSATSQPAPSQPVANSEPDPQPQPDPQPAAQPQLEPEPQPEADPQPAAQYAPASIAVVVVVQSNVVDNPVSGEVTLELEEGATAYDALVAAGFAVNARQTQYGVYVAGINGLVEKQHGGASGWLYAVNGATPSFSAGSYTLADGDIVEWFYTV